MPRPIFTDANLLQDLEEIADLCIGNEKPEDVGFRQRTAYPELLAYAMMNPKSEMAVKDAITKQIVLEKKVEALGKKLRIMLKQITIKRKKS
jgi:hypothetical protein